MTWLLRVLSICATLVMAPAYAADASQHAAHHPDTATNAAVNDSGSAQPATQTCPMMDGQTANGQMMGGQGAQMMSGQGHQILGGQGKSGMAGTGPSGMMSGPGASGQSSMMGGQAQMGAEKQCPHMPTQTKTR
jgi:hypothetical protein